MTNKKLSREQFYKELAKARKEPAFRKEIRAFIKASTSVYKLKDYGLENL